MTNFGYTLQRFRCLSQPMQASDNWYADWDRIRRAKTLSGEDQKNQVLYDRKNTNVPFKKVEFEEKSELYNWWKFAQSIKPDFEDDKRGTAEIFLEKALQHEEHEPIMLAAQASQVIE